MSSNYLHCIFTPEVNLSPSMAHNGVSKPLLWFSEKQQHPSVGSYILHIDDYVSTIQLFIERVKLL